MGSTTIYTTTAGDLEQLHDQLDQGPQAPPEYDPVPRYWRNPENPVQVEGWGWEDLDPADPEVGPQPDLVWALHLVGEAAEAIREQERAEYGIDGGASRYQLPAPAIVAHSPTAAILQWTKPRLLTLRLRRPVAVPKLVIATPAMAAAAGAPLYRCRQGCGRAVHRAGARCQNCDEIAGRNMAALQGAGSRARGRGGRDLASLLD